MNILNPINLKNSINRILNSSVLLNTLTFVRNAWTLYDTDNMTSVTDALKSNQNPNICGLKPGVSQHSVAYQECLNTGQGAPRR